MRDKIKLFSLLSAILFFIVGIYILINPLSNMAFLGFMFAVAMLISGGSEVSTYFSTQEKHRSIWLLVDGIVTILLAIWLIFSQTSDLSSFVPTLFALWVFISGLSRVLDALRLKKIVGANTVRLDRMMKLGIIGMVFGFILWLNLGLASSIITILMAVVFFYQAFIFLSTYLSIK